MTARVRVLATLVLLSMLPLGCARATSADRTKLWQEAPVAVAAPELTRFNDLLADLAERLKPALVHVRVRRGGSVAKDDDAPGEPRRSTGSGFVIDPNGLIVTNAHVVEQAEWIQVRLADGRRFNGRTVGLDSRVDLALVRIDASGLPVLPLVPQLASKGKSEWGWLGVSIAEVTDEDVPRLKLRDAPGVLVRGVMPGEPAPVGGVKADDVLVAVDGTPLEGPRDLQRVVSSTPVGKRVRLVLLREGRETEVEVTIGLYKEREARERDEAPKDKDAPADGPKESPKTK